MDQRLPIILVTGFLGAGKTTLIRRLFAAPHGQQIGLVLNEVGQAGIDDVSAAQQAFVELAEGCACCLLNPDLVESLQELVARGDLDRAVVETSGLADPLPLTWTMTRPELVDRVRLDLVLTVVDAANYERSRTEEWESQVRCADLVVLSKPDLAGAEGIAKATKVIREVNPRARIVTANDSLPVEVIFDYVPETPRSLPLQNEAEGSGARHSSFRSVLFSGPERYDSDRLEDLLEELPSRIFRAKGIVPVAEQGWVSFHVVGGRLEFDPDAPAPGHGEGRLVFFGPDLTKDEVAPLLEACRLIGADAVERVDAAVSRVETS